MIFKDFLHRASFKSLEYFIRCGSDEFSEEKNQKYTEKLAEARKNLDKFAEKRFPDLKEYDEVMNYIDEQIFAVESVYFEIGLILGGNFGYKLCEKMQELK